MTKFLIAMLILCVGLTTLRAQEPDAPNPTNTVTDSVQPVGETGATQEDAADKYVLRVGPTLGLFGGGMNTQNAEGRKVNPDFWAIPSYGAVINAPFGKKSKIAGRLELAVNTLGTRTRPFELYDDKTSWTGYLVERYTYFTVAPQFNLSGLVLGVGINIPMKGEMWHPTTKSEVFVVDRATMKTALDFRLGGTISVWETPVGALFVDITAKYVFSGLYEPDLYAFGGPVDDVGKAIPTNQTATHIEYIPVSVQLGITYLFDIKF